MAKVYVDKDLCIGCGACTGIACESFEFGDDGLAVVIDDSVNDEVREALECCPTGAIEIEED